MTRWLWLTLALVVSAAGADRLTTFAWDAGLNWPVGTTVELCSNGVCASGITSVQHTLNVPIQPGDAIQARARAVTPAGYQCGDPPIPCPYSDWATLSQTWPATPIGGWARYQQVQNMAISYLGYATVLDADGTMSQSVTVPANTNYAVIFVGGWSGTAITVSSMSLDGVAATNLYTRANTDNYQDSYVYGVATSAGSKTFAASLSGSFGDGGIAIIVFLSGVDTASPLVTSGYGYSEATDPGVQDKTITSVPTANGGIGLVFGTGVGSTFNFDVQSQTSIFEASSNYNSDYYGAGYKYTTGATTTFGSSQANGTYSAIVVVTLNPSTGGAATALPRRAFDGPFVGAFRGSVR